MGEKLQGQEGAQKKNRDGSFGEAFHRHAPEWCRSRKAVVFYSKSFVAPKRAPSARRVMFIVWMGRTVRPPSGGSCLWIGWEDRRSCQHMPEYLSKHSPPGGSLSEKSDLRLCNRSYSTQL